MNKNPLFVLLAGLALYLMLPLAGCRHGHNAGWPEIEKQADAVNDSLETKWRSGTLSLADTVLVNRLDSISRTNPNKEIKARAAYWSRQLAAKGWHDADWGTGKLAEALHGCDTVAYPYDMVRFRMCLDESTAMPQTLMRYCVEGADFLKEHGDDASYAQALSRLAHMLWISGDTVSYRKLNLMSEQLAEKAGAHWIAAHSRYERITDLFDKGKIESAGAMTDSLLKSPGFESLGWQKGIVWNWKYLQDRNPEWLHKAYREGLDNGDIRNLATLSAGTIACDWLDKGNQDSVAKWFSRYKAGLHEISGDPVWVLKIGERLYENTGQMDTVRMLRALRTGYTEGLKQRQTAYDLQDARYSLIINSLQMGGRRSPLFWIIGGIGLVILAFILLTLVCRKRRGKLASCSETASIGEKGESEIKDDKEPLVSELEWQRISARVMEGVNDGQSWDEVEQVVKHCVPGFLVNLRKTYPDITRAEMRLACLAVAGVDTKATARVLAIAPDSVKKLRQRLRRKLNLTASQELTSFLRGLV